VNNEKWNRVYHGLSILLSKRRTRTIFYITIVLWIAVFTQVAVNRVFQEELQITEAFIKSETVEMKSSMDIVGEYGVQAFGDAGKKELIHRIAQSIGLTVDSDITIWSDEDRSEYYYYKKARQASTEIKVVSLENKDESGTQMKHYIVVQLSIEKGISGIDHYKKLLEKELTDIGVENLQINLKYEGNREGNLTTQQKREIAAMLVQELQGDIAIDYDEGDLYIVYAYTGLIDEFVTTLDNKINIQIAITYNELTNKTRITLATPMLNDGI